jgi:hypothetical protein
MLCAHSHNMPDGPAGGEAMNTKTKLRIAQIVEWSRGGQTCIALLRDEAIIGRFHTMTEARAAYAKARKVTP